jgi:hypothetical protein
MGAGKIMAAAGASRKPRPVGVFLLSFGGASLIASA